MRNGVSAVNVHFLIVEVGDGGGKHKVLYGGHGSSVENVPGLAGDVGAVVWACTDSDNEILIESEKKSRGVSVNPYIIPLSAFSHVFDIVPSHQLSGVHFYTCSSVRDSNVANRTHRLYPVSNIQVPCRSMVFWNRH
jgi:hypothetical protein